eukprot:Blabericola_migrator_1__1194@NODE_1305_length_4850_cov_295_065649_g878_i0_p5_GENE_NODE_1305_length_4850_cov_295_065649_g878_i0NODE_1305_length_4850_cov_295_065649_g878_i0_p5_ORF_typecomplete_len122_score11_63_NODE_1305_length_4850_cov_295_065649_g878_i043124677
MMHADLCYPVRHPVIFQEGLLSVSVLLASGVSLIVSAWPHWRYYVCATSVTLSIIAFIPTAMTIQENSRLLLVDKRRRSSSTRASVLSLFWWIPVSRPGSMESQQSDSLSDPSIECKSQLL